MKKLRSLNNNIICTPIKEGYAKSAKVGSLSILSTTVGLAPLTVLMDGEISICNSCCQEVYEGDTVYVRGDAYTSGWNKAARECPEIVDKDGKPVKFIVVPGSEVIFVSHEEKPATLPKPDPSVASKTIEKF